MGIEVEEMEFAGVIFCQPMTLIINFSLFQYLATFYFKRRSEVRSMLLIFCAFFGFACLIPYAHSDANIVGHLNDVSETMTCVTFLIQIVIVGRDVNRKVRIRSLKYIAVTGEGLILLGLVVVGINLMEVTGVDVSAMDGVDNIFEMAALVFIFVARFYYIVMSRGLKETLKTKKLELFTYTLFMTHELPFMLLEEVTGVTWEPVQALWNRLTVTFCIVLTIQEKLRSRTSNKSTKPNTKHTTIGPNEQSLQASEPSTVGTARTAKSPTFKSIVAGVAVHPFRSKGPA